MSRLPRDLFDLCTKLQKTVSWGKPEVEIKEIEGEILRWTPHFPSRPVTEQERREQIAYFKQRGRDFKAQWDRIEPILNKNKFDPQIAAALSDETLLPEVRDKLMTRLSKKVLGEAYSLYASGDSAALSSYAARAMAACPMLCPELQSVLDDAERRAAEQPAPAAPQAAQAEAPSISIPRNDHRISTREPRAKWTLWLDETGKDFDLLQTSGGTKAPTGRFAALLVPPSGITLPPLGANFHATNMPLPALLPYMAELLSKDCGIFGLAADCLRSSRREGWYSLLVETILWSLRLLPLPADGSRVEVDIFVEERESFSSREKSDALRHSISRLIGQERFGSRIILGEVAFKPENSGLLGWADMVANLWGSPSSAKQKVIEDSGLPGTCLFSSCSPLIEAAQKALQGERLSAEQWHLLCSAEDAGIEGSLPFLALQALRETCAAEEGDQYSAAWHPYIMHCAGVLEKRYSLSAVEAQIRWLRHADKDRLSLVDRFFLGMNELAFCNHMGDISSPELRAAVSVVETYATAVAGVHPLVNAQATLRLAVSYANAFDFETASDLLHPWVLGEKSRTLNAELTGKFLSSMGQYEAFCQRHKSADDCFSLALSHFRSLMPVDAKTASKQLSQTSVYAATNAMDWAEKTQEDVVKAMEQALGCRLEEAIRTDAISDDRYRVSLLYRYLTARGTEEEKSAMLSRSGSWLLTGRGQKMWPWPLIWYHRAVLAGEAGNAELRKSMAEQLEHCKEVNDITIQLIIAVLETALGEADPAEPETAAVLAKARQLMPAAKDRIDKVTSSRKGDPALVEDVLSFNYR